MIERAEAAVAIVRAGGAAQSVLLIRRSEREDDPWSGHWSFPGGRCDPEDRDLLDTALRELQEECGIRLSRDQLEAALPHEQARRRTPPYLLVAPFVFAVEQELPTVLDAREAAGSLWVPLRDLRDPSRHALRPVPGPSREALFPAIDLNGTPLWGFTYRLIADWLGLAAKGSAFPDAARALEFLLARGLTLKQNWPAQVTTRQVAIVEGTIPVEELRAYFGNATGEIPSASCVEVYADVVRVIGPMLEEHLIRAV